MGLITSPLLLLRPHNCRFCDLSLQILKCAGSAGSPLPGIPKQVLQS